MAEGSASAPAARTSAAGARRIRRQVAAAQATPNAMKSADHTRDCVCSGRKGSTTAGYASSASSEPRFESA